MIRQSTREIEENERLISKEPDGYFFESNLTLSNIINSGDLEVTNNYVLSNDVYTGRKKK